MKNFKIFNDTQRFEPSSKFVNKGFKVNFQPLFQPYSVFLNTFIFYITLLCVDIRIQLLLHSTVPNSHINVNLEVSHKHKLQKVTGYKYILHFLYKYGGTLFTY